MRPPVATPRVREYLHIVLSSWLVIICATVLSAAVGWLSWQVGPPVYQSATKLFVITPGNATTIDAYYGQLNAALRAPTYLQLARSGFVTTRTIEQLGLAETPDALAARIVVTPAAAVVLNVTVTGSDPELTRQTADAVADNMVALSREMSAVETADTELAEVGEAGPAHRQGSMVRVIVQATAVGFVLSLLLVIAHGLLRDRLLARGQVSHVIRTMSQRHP